jgi:hypothetical protein
LRLVAESPSKVLHTRENDMRKTLASMVVLSILLLTPMIASAQEPVTVTLHDRALLGNGGQSLQLVVDITCQDLGIEDFQQGLAFGTQHRGPNIREGEGGVDGTIVCDGVTRTHTATVSLFQGSRFLGGPATATVAVLACFIDESGSQVCGQDVDTRTVLVAG